MKRSQRNLWLLIGGCLLLLVCAILSACAILYGIVAISSVRSSDYTPEAGIVRPITVPFPVYTPPAPDAGQDTLALLTQVEVPPRDLRILTERLRANAGPIPKVVRETPHTYRVGDTATFWVSNQDDNRHFQITARMLYMTAHVYMWVEEGASVNQRDLQASAERFEGNTYQTNRQFFGTEWTPGVDADPRLFILHAQNLGSQIAGYYSSADEYSLLAHPFSNEHEMFYINLDATQPNTSFYDSVLAHEFQHMIHWYQDRNEETWVNEGLSELAAQLNGFERGQSGVIYTRAPYTQLNTWTDDPGGNGAHYAGAYLFMSYFLDRFGEDLTRSVVASDLNGAAGFNDALAQEGRRERFDEVFSDWLVANLLDDARLLDGRYGYQTIDPSLISPVVIYRNYPAESTGRLPSYGAEYAVLSGSGDVTISFSGAPTTRLVATEPHSGRFAFWGNRSDDGDATLTRTFDLSNVVSATLEAWVWYDLEPDFDYAYTVVSTNGGETWTVLPGRTTTEYDPVGNSFGHGHTGASGGGEEPEWVQERYDLTPYVGQEVSVRFEYITDDAVNYPGWLLDDLAIPQIGYREDFEQGDGGWQTAGFVRTDNVLPQQWLVQVVERDRSRGETVRRLDVGLDGRGTWTISDLGRGRDAVLIISPLAPVTTEESVFHYTIQIP